MTDSSQDSTDSPEKTEGPETDEDFDASTSSGSSDATTDEDESDDDAKPKKKGSTFKETAILAVLALTIYYVTLTFIARPYLIPSESMEPTLQGHAGSGDRIMVDKMVYRFGSPEPGDVIVFKGPPAWNEDYKSIRSHNTAVRYVQNALSFLGFVPPDENDLVKRVIAVGGQTVECRNDTGLTVDGKPLDQPFLNPETLGNFAVYPCLNVEFGPVKVPDGQLWVMGDNRTHSADSRAHCNDVQADVDRGIKCTGVPVGGTVPVENVIGKARFIAWPPSRWGLVRAVDIQQGQ